MAFETLLKVLTNQEERRKLNIEELRELEDQFIRAVLQNEEPMIM